MTSIGTYSRTSYMAQQIRRLKGGAVNLFDFQAAGDGNNDDTSAFTQAVASGAKTIVVDEVPGGYYKVTSTIALGSNLMIVAGRGRPKIALVSGSVSRVFTMSGASRSGISGLEIDGTQSIHTDATVVVSGGSTDCFVDNCVFTSAASAGTGAVVLSGATTKRNRISNNMFTSPYGTAIGVTSAGENEITGNRIRSGGGFGIRIGEAGFRNLVQGNSCITTTIESIVCYYDCYQNRIIGNHCELAGDNGISISGYMNVVEGNICYKNSNAGIGVWGEYNTICGNVIVSNNQSNTAFWAGVWMHSMYGGTGSFNTILGNMCDDDQASPTQVNGVRFQGNGYTVWAAGRVITAGDGNTEWTYYGLNVYRAATSGTTGATPPTHTSGTVSDGGVSWTYVRSFVTNARTEYNIVSGNVVPRFKTAAYFDSASWADNVLSAAQSGASSFGVLTANADAPVSGYITIRDSGGTLRKLAVIT